MIYERRSLSRRRFESIVRRALRRLPPELAARLENIDILVRTRPTAAMLQRSRVEPGGMLLGLYVGTSLAHRGGGYTFVLPDRIFVFQEPLERLSRNENQLIARIERTVLHEVAHHFGISDARLREIGRY